MALEKQSQDSPQSTQRSQGTAPQSASVFSVPSVVDGSSDGYRVTYLPVDRDGLLKLADLEAAITDQTAIVSLMWANNETGVLFPVEQTELIEKSNRWQVGEWRGHEGCRRGARIQGFRCIDSGLGKCIFERTYKRTFLRTYCVLTIT